MTVYHPKMAAMTNSNFGDIWRSKRQAPLSHWYKQNGNRDKVESLKETQIKKWSVEIIPPSSGMNANVKPFHPRNRGLARSEGLWDMYCNNKPDIVIFDRQAGNDRSSWPDIGDDMLTEQIENSDARTLHIRTYEEKDFWGYFLPNTVFTKERTVSWGLSVPTDWQSPVYIRFPISLLGDSGEVISEKSNFVGTDFGNEAPATLCTASEKKVDHTGSKFESPPEISRSFRGERSNGSSDVVLLSSSDNAEGSGHLTYTMNNILFGMPSRSGSQKRRPFSGMSRIVGDSCSFYRNNSSPVLTVL